MFWVVAAILYFVLAAVAPSILGLFVNRARPDFGALSLSLRGVFAVIALICLAATSYVHVESDEIAVLNKIYGTTSLVGEHIIATDREKGPQGAFARRRGKNDSPLEREVPKVCRLFAGGEWIRNFSSAMPRHRPQSGRLHRA
jgi:hypothetical protein